MLNESQVLSNIDICIESGIEKVFLINHAVSVGNLILCANKARTQYPNLWIGVNMLGMDTEFSIHQSGPKLSGMLTGIDGLWCDATISPEKAKEIRNYKGMFFGGLAFKYQPQPTDLEQACKDAKLATDVATTSGSGTGKAATVVKIKTIREYLGDHPMAIASGISIDNISSYNGLANYLLVASSITDRSEMIIKDKLVELKDKL